jgi:two-component system response regulator NreC
MHNNKIRILLADGQKLFRDGLHSLLEKQQDFMVIGTADNYDDAVNLALQLSAQIVLLNINAPNLNSIEAARRIKDDCPETKVIALSKCSDREFIEGMLKAGTSAYLLQNCSTEELYHAIRITIENSTYFCQEVARKMVMNYLQDHGNDHMHRLTDREMQVLKQITDGKKNYQVARNLNIAVKTVETYRRQIMKKLNLNTIVELTKYAIRKGITSLE